MTIAKKLYLGFGGMIVLALILSGVGLFGLWREGAAKRKTNRSFQVLRDTSTLQYLLSENQIHLNNYLLSGDSSEADKVLNGVTQLDEAIHRTEVKATTEEQIPLEKLNEAVHDWTEHFARPLIEKRRQVDSGNGTVAELQIFYLQLNPGDWIKKVKDPIDQTIAATEQDLKEQQDSDSTKGTITEWGFILAVVFGICGGIYIAYRTALSISEPLMHLMLVAREIGESGDLDQKIDIDRKDEVGELSKTLTR